MKRATHGFINSCWWGRRSFETHSVRGGGVSCQSSSWCPGNEDSQSRQFALALSFNGALTEGEGGGPDGCMVLSPWKQLEEAQQGGAGCVSEVVETVGNI